MKVSEPPVKVEQIFNNSIDDVWLAITSLDKMTQWYFENIPEFEAIVGFRTKFNVKAPSRDYLHQWRIIEVIPKQKISYNWNYKDLEGDANVSFELFQLKNETKLIVTMEILEDFDDSIPEFKRESCQNGWKYFINERLVSYLSND